MSETRGVRNFNPGNIEKGKEKWQGLAADQPDPRFLKFQSPAWGIRAIARILINYQDKYGINTVRGIVGRWAPPSENDTAAYVIHVADRANVRPDQPLDLHTYEHLRPVVVGIIAHENANFAYPADVVDEGLKLAGVVPAKRSIVASPTIKAAAIGGGAGIGGIATVINEVAQNPQLREAAQSSGVWWLPVLLSLAAAASLGFIAYTAWRKHQKATA